MIAAQPRPRVRTWELRKVTRLLARFAGGRRVYVLALVMLVFEAITAVFEPYPLAYLIDFLQGHRPALGLDLPLLSSPRSETIAVLTIGLLILAMVNSLGDSMAEIYFARGGRVLGYNVRAALHAHLQRLSLAFHDQRRAGDMVTRVTGDVTALEEFIVDSVGDLSAGFLLLAGTLAYLFYKSWQTALIAVLVVPVLAAISNHYSKGIKTASKRQRASEGDLASTTQEMLTSIRVIQTYGRGAYETERFATQSRMAMEAALVSARLQARFSWVVAVLESVATGAVVWAGLWLIDRHAISIGTLVLFTILIRNMFRPTRKIIREWSTIGKVFASAERVAEVLDREVSVVDAPDAVEAPKFRGAIGFEHVHFAYKADPEDEAVTGDSSRRVALQDVDFSIEPGQTFALVGPSGAGKSTIAQLLPRLYDPDLGTVRVDGRDIREYTLESLRSQISVVLQDTVLFSGTVADNIAYGRAGATRDEVVEAAIRANADGFIRELPDGYDTMLGERAANMSGGQRQRIAIARAFIRNTPILILDEPTTGLDATAAEQVLLGLQSLMQGKTTVIVTHNLGLIRSANKILVVDEGRMLEEGTHDSLMAQGGAYARYCEKHGAPGTVVDVVAETGNGRQRGRAREGRVARYLASLLRGDARTEPESDDRPPALAPQPVAASRPLADPLPSGIDALSSPHLHAALPGLRRALDSAAVTADLQAHLFAPGVTVRACTPGKCLYLGEDGCSLRYTVEVLDQSGQPRSLLVLARVLGDAAAAESYQRTLAPLADAMDGRVEAAGLARPFATLDGHLVVHAFPIDPGLPTLVAATDAERVTELLRRIDAGVAHCTVELGPYNRRHRCVLRYEVDGNGGGRRTVYGKVFDDGRGEFVADVLQALDGRLQGTAVPKLYATVPELRLSLMEALPGAPALSRELRSPGGRPDQLVDDAARTAAALHQTDVELGSRRSMDDTLDELLELLLLVERIAPALADTLEGILYKIVSAAYSTPALPLQLSHGDLAPSQLLAGPEGSGLVDFDSVGQAEAALDLGHYLAYLRLSVAKTRPGDPGLADLLAGLFLTSYMEAGGLDTSAWTLKTRVQVYECVSLFRTTVHAWQKLKGPRTRAVFGILSEQAARLSV